MHLLTPAPAGRLRLPGRSRPARRRAGFGAGLLVVAWCLIWAPPAQAHTELIRMEPAAQSSVAALPERVRLVFSEELQSRFARVAVTASDGQRLEDGAPRIEGRALIQPLRPAPATGSVTVAFRVISVDGHPVSGSREFTVTGGPGAGNGTRSPTPVAAPAPVAGIPAPAPPRVPAANEPAAQQPAGHLEHLLAPGVMLVGAAGVGLVALWRRTRAGRDEE